MQVSPTIDLVLKIVLTVANGVVNGTLGLTGVLDPQQTAIAIAASQVVITVIGMFAAAYSSSAPGPLAPPDPPAVVAATRVTALPSNATPSEVGAAKNIAKATIDSTTPTGAPK